MSGGKSKSSSESQNTSSSFIDPAQAAFLQQMRTQGQDLAAQQMPQIAEQSLALQNQLSAQGDQFAGALQGQATGQNPFINNLQQLGSQGNQFLDQQIQGIGGDISRFLGQNLQGIGQGFASANQFGGGRQGLAEGVAVGEAVNEFGQQAANLRGGDLQRQAAANQAGGALQGQAATQGMAGLGDRFNLGLGSFGASFQPLLNQQQLIGAPTVLGTSQGTSSSDSFAMQGGII